MARYDLPDEAWTLIQPLLPSEPATPRAGRPWAEHRMIINGMFQAHHGAICMSDMVHGRPFTTVLTDGQSQE
jgi:transposase